MSNDQFINQKYLQSYKKNYNLEDFYIIIKTFYTKVSCIKRLTNSPQIYNFACPQANKEQLTCPQLQK